MSPGTHSSYEAARPMMTIREAAAVLNVHLATLRRWDKSGFLVSTRVGSRGHRRYSRERILDLANPAPDADPGTNAGA